MRHVDVLTRTGAQVERERAIIFARFQYRTKHIDIGPGLNC